LFDLISENKSPLASIDLKITRLLSLSIERRSIEFEEAYNTFSIKIFCPIAKVLISTVARIR
jgi:hypothetical protein